MRPLNGFDFDVAGFQAGQRLEGLLQFFGGGVVRNRAVVEPL